ncbi:MAG: FHA domain-containing protein [Dehalococcoidia bacterium]|nr:FHA domain-containing protein [Dehalococcoidia bacterium]
MSALLFALAVMLVCLSAVALTHVCAYAMGAPTDNFTIPDPMDDAQHNEIKPPVIFILRSTTALPLDASPELAATIQGTSPKGSASITGDEQWYLDVDINMPGWLYIYEYYPAAGDDQGRWIAYKWQLTEQGQWRLGPFRPGEDEPEGQHIYRLFFYGNGQWAADSGKEQRSSLVYWNYIKDQVEPDQPAQPAQPTQPTQPDAPSTPEPPATQDNSLLKFITNPFFLLIAPSAIVIIVLLGLYARRRLRQQSLPGNTAQQPLVELLEQPGTPPKSPVHGAPMAILELPNGLKIRLSEESEIIGRAQVARSLGLDELGMISKQHFKISFADGKSFIEDMGSANGTTVNGADIRDAGPVELKDEDVIEMAGTTSLKFRSSH